jgi:hypothetical protein
MRTQEEILARIQLITPRDVFGFQSNDLIMRLTYQNALPHLNDGVTAEQWAESVKDLDTPAACIKDYMPFAWNKANSCRGLSAMRNIEHMRAWLWLDGKDELCNQMDGLYDFYGKPCLVKICKAYEIDWRAYDDGKWRRDELDSGIPAAQALA